MSWADVEYFANLLSKVAIISGVVAIWYNWKNLTRSRRAEKAGIFQSLRSGYVDALSVLDDEIPDFANVKGKLNYAHLNGKQRSALKRYWIHSFNEWYITNIIYDPKRIELWGEFFEPAQKSALHLSCLRDALVQIFSDKTFSLGNKKREYRAEITRLLRSELGIDLDAAIAEAEKASQPGGARYDIDFEAKHLFNTPVSNDEIKPRLEEMRAKLLKIRAEITNRADIVDWFACVCAWKAAAEGNFGVGAVWTDSDGDVRGYHFNTVHTDKRNCAHAEMNLIDYYHLDSNGAGTQIVSSLEPCPICLSRFLMSAVPQIRYVADDPIGGMVRLKDCMPGYWHERIKDKLFPTSTNTRLKEIAFELFEVTKDLNKELGGE
ncbi:nucleoside deaminase [Rhodobacteraceae bacterium NNCM2]|nr:nucleoside deaminase [Coraliihabitans acroporae]